LILEVNGIPFSAIADSVKKSSWVSVLEINGVTEPLRGEELPLLILMFKAPAGQPS
jgi:hypothetical protein